MVGRSRDYLTPSLFELDPAYHFNEHGEIVDKVGNIYDQDYNLIKVAPSPGLLKARKQHPEWTDEELAPLAKIYNGIIKAEQRKRAKRKNEGSFRH